MSATVAPSKVLKKREYFLGPLSRTVQPDAYRNVAKFLIFSITIPKFIIRNLIKNSFLYQVNQYVINCHTLKANNQINTNFSRKGHKDGGEKRKRKGDKSAGEL